MLWFVDKRQIVALDTDWLPIQHHIYANQFNIDLILYQIIIGQKSPWYWAILQMKEALNYLCWLATQTPWNTSNGQLLDIGTFSVKEML